MGLFTKSLIIFFTLFLMIFFQNCSSEQLPSDLRNQEFPVTDPEPDPDPDPDIIIPDPEPDPEMPYILWQSGPTIVANAGDEVRLRVRVAHDENVFAAWQKDSSPFNISQTENRSYFGVDMDPGVQQSTKILILTEVVPGDSGVYRAEIYDNTKEEWSEDILLIVN